MRLALSIVVLGLLPMLACCSVSPHQPARAAADGTNMRSVMGETVTAAPLTPEPGDIWADLDFLKRPTATASADTPRQPAEPTAITPREPAEPTARTPREPVKSVTGASRQYFVQLAATPSEEAARHEWQQLQRRLPDLFGSRTPAVVAAEVAGRPLWRLRTGGFASQAEAAAFCTELQSRQSQCWVVAGAS